MLSSTDAAVWNQELKQNTMEHESQEMPKMILRVSTWLTQDPYHHHHLVWQICTH